MHIRKINTTLQKVPHNQEGMKFLWDLLNRIVCIGNSTAIQLKPALAIAAPSVFQETKGASVSDSGYSSINGDDRLSLSTSSNSSTPDSTIAETDEKKTQEQDLLKARPAHTSEEMKPTERKREVSQKTSYQQNIAEDPKSANTPPQLQRAESGYESGTESISSNDEDSQLNPGSTFADITEYNLLITKSRLAVENLEKDQEKKSQLEKFLENYKEINEENNQQLNEHFKGHIPMGNKNISDTKEVTSLNKEEIKKLQKEIKSIENTIQNTRLDITKFREEKRELEEKIWPETLSWYE